MAHLIDKDKVIEEVKHHLKVANTGIEYSQKGIDYGLDEYKNDLNAWEHCQSMCKNILAFLDMIEVKHELTWQDIELIATIGMDFMNSEDSDDLDDEAYYTEILNRFNKQKENGQ